MLSSNDRVIFGEIFETSTLFRIQGKYIVSNTKNWMHVSREFLQSQSQMLDLGYLRNYILDSMYVSNHIWY